MRPCVTAEALTRQNRLPLVLGTALAALLIGGVAVASASLPDRHEPMVSTISEDAAIEPEGPRPEYSFASPLPGQEINSPFGLRKLPWEEGGRLHQGVDIAAPTGTPVRAMTLGLVVRSGVDGGYGRFVEVRHKGGLSSIYAHLGRTADGLARGSLLHPGDIVGYVGSTGRSTGAHLHFEIRRDGRPLNPAAFIDRQFATHADLPLRSAARVPRKVRIAQVSDWPPGIPRPKPEGRKASKRGKPAPAEAAAPAETAAVTAPASADA